MTLLTNVKYCGCPTEAYYEQHIDSQSFQTTSTILVCVELDMKLILRKRFDLSQL